MIKMLASNVMAKEEQLFNLVYNFVWWCVVDVILFFYEKQGEGNISILCDDLVCIVGIVKESVICMFIEFKEDGYIEVIDGVIKIVDLEGFCNMYVQLVIICM